MKKFIRLLSGKNSGDKPAQDPVDYYNELAIDVLARTVWGEARGEGQAGMEAVASDDGNGGADEIIVIPVTTAPPSPPRRGAAPR